MFQWLLSLPTRLQTFTSSACPLTLAVRVRGQRRAWSCTSPSWCPTTRGPAQSSGRQWWSTDWRDRQTTTRSPSCCLIKVTYVWTSFGQKGHKSKWIRGPWTVDFKVQHLFPSKTKKETENPLYTTASFYLETKPQFLPVPWSLKDSFSREVKKANQRTFFSLYVRIKLCYSKTKSPY